MSNIPCKDCLTLSICKARYFKNRHPDLYRNSKIKGRRALLEKCSILSNWYDKLYHLRRAEIHSFFERKNDD